MMQIDKKTYCYVFLRTDISLSQQIVQSNHAALEVGLKTTERYNEPSSIVLIQIPNRDQLELEFQKFEAMGISCAAFYEPYDDMGMTAFATLPLGEESRHLFKEYTLWGRSVKGIKTPLTEFLKQEKKEEMRQKKLKEQMSEIIFSSEEQELLGIQLNDVQTMETV